MDDLNPFDRAAIDGFLDRLTRDALHGVTPEDIDEAAQYAAWPWWRRTVERLRERRSLRRLRRRWKRTTAPRPTNQEGPR